MTTGNILQIPYKKENLNKWTILIIDIEYHIEKFQFFQPGLYKSFKNIFQLKSIMICSNLTFRNAYSSNNFYDIKVKLIKNKYIK